MYAFLILDMNGVVCTYGNIPNTDPLDTKHFEYVSYNEDSDIQLLDQNFLEPVNRACGTLLDPAEDDFFGKEKCVLLKKWLESQLHESLHPRLKEIYEALLDFSKRAIELNTGIVIEY
ncbi:MAG: hypothetical protein HUK21_11975 [Fibrobacteraceae bacterium]|nr:hypothetical protein [Fibrobacteraceae bacterium]